ncbi:MAG: hypothetical protein H6765_04210 [Candidatus Peribacteria bacterium]|nr:MAG: hypothetical protein H6765_04210 [Candidatus Peribacteria bacterium]
MKTLTNLTRGERDHLPLVFIMDIRIACDEEVQNPHNPDGWAFHYVRPGEGEDSFPISSFQRSYKNSTFRYSVAKSTRDERTEQGIIIKKGSFFLYDVAKKVDTLVACIMATTRPSYYRICLLSPDFRLV